MNWLSTILLLLVSSLTWVAWAWALHRCARLEQCAGERVPILAGTGALTVALILLLGGWRLLVAPLVALIVHVPLLGIGWLIWPIAMLVWLIWAGFVAGLLIAQGSDQPARMPARSRRWQGDD